MERSLGLLLVAGLLAALLPAAASTFGPQPGAPCEPTLLATQVALFCASDMPTAECCEPVVSAVDLGGGVPCLCLVAAEPQLVMAGLNATHLLELYVACGGPQDGARLAAACEGPTPPAAVVSIPPPPPPSPAPRRKQPAHDAPPPPPASGDKPSSPPPQEHDGAAHAKAVDPAHASTSPLAPAAATAPPQTAHEAPSPSPSSESPPSAAQRAVLVLGYICSGALYLSPIPTIVGIYRARDVGAYNVDMFLATLVSCIVWTFYGFHPFSLALVLVNGIGAVVQLVYLGLFVRYMAPEGRLQMFISIMVIGVATGILAAITSFRVKDPQLALGIIGDLASAVMYAGPIRQVISVWRDNNVGNMSFLVAVISLASGICWTAYGCLPVNIVLIVAGASGMVSGLGQVGVWLWVRFGHQE